MIEPSPNPQGAWKLGWSFTEIQVGTKGARKLYLLVTQAFEAGTLEGGQILGEAVFCS